MFGILRRFYLLFWLISGIGREEIGLSNAFVNNVYPFRVIASHTSPTMLLDDNKFVSDAMQKRIDAGSLTAFDLNKLYSLTRRDEEDLSSGITSRLRGKDRVGVVIGLESCLLDSTPIIGRAFTLLAAEFGLLSPTPEKVKYCAGLTLSRCFAYFEWPFDLCKDGSLEARFITLLEKVIDSRRWEIQLRPGAWNLLDTFLSPDKGVDGKDFSEKSALRVVITSSLPRSSALKLLGATPMLPQLLAARRLSLESLVTSTDIIKTGAQIVRCCAKLSLSPSLNVAIDSSVPSLVEAKRLGLGAIGVKGSAALHYQLRAADKVVSTLADITIDDVIDVVVGSYSRNKGPKPATASVPVLEKTTVRSVAAPAMDQKRNKQDTFADEFGSDIT